MTAPPQVAGIALGARLGSGGEADVYEVRGCPDLVAKIYRKPTAERAAKLAAMLARPPVDPGGGVSGQPALAWPRELVRSRAGNVIGFTMPRIDVAQAAVLVDVFTPKRRRKQCPDFSWRYLLRTARNLAAVVAALHDAGYVIGDLSEVNTFVDLTAMVTVVDCDSFQVRDPAAGRVYLNPVCRPDRTPPELQRHNRATLPRTHAADDFALAVLIFQLLLDGAHPFAGSFPGDPDPPPPIEQRIALGQYIRASPGIPPTFALPVSLLPPRLRELMVDAFVAGHADPARRPSATAWTAALTAAEGELVDCRRSSTHVYSRHLRRCPWCERFRQTGADTFAPGVGRADGSGTTTSVQSPLAALTGFGQPGPRPSGRNTVPAQPTGPHGGPSGLPAPAPRGGAPRAAGASLFAPEAVAGDSRSAALLRRHLPWLYGVGAGAVAAAFPLWALVVSAAGLALVAVAGGLDELRTRMPRRSGPADWLLTPLRAGVGLGRAGRRGAVALGRGLLGLAVAGLVGTVLATLVVAGLLLSDRDLAPEGDGEVFGALLGERLPEVALRMATAGIVGLLVVRWLKWVDRCPPGTHRHAAPVLRRVAGAGEWGLVGQWLIVPAAAVLLAALAWSPPWAPYGSAEETWVTVTAPFRGDVPDPAGRPQAAGYAGLLTRAGTLTEAAFGAMVAVRGDCTKLDSARRTLDAVADERVALREADLTLPVDEITKGSALRTELARTLDAERANERAFARWAQARQSTRCKPFADAPQAKAVKTTLVQAQAARAVLAAGWNRVAARYGLSTREPSQM